MNIPDNFHLVGTDHTPVNTTMHLRVVSPTKGVPDCLDFQHLPTATTVVELKNQIRDRVHSKPLADDQRLIWRGKALVNDNQTLADVFGDDVGDLYEQQTIHLVVRNLPESGTTTPAATAVSNTTATTNPNTIAETDGGLRSRLTSVREHHGGVVRAIVTSNQRARAEAGLHGLAQANHRDTATTTGSEQVNRPATWSWPTQPSNQQIPSQNARGSEQSLFPNSNNSPLGTASTLPSVQAGNSVPTFRERDVYRVIPGLERALDRGRDRSADSRTAGATSMQRSVSGASLGGSSFTQPGVTVPAYGNAGASRFTSGRATPVTSNPSITNQAELFIVSSPEGPQYLLLNPAAHDSYYPPRTQTQPNTSIAGLDPSWSTPWGTPSRSDVMSRMDLYDQGEVFRNRPDLRARSDRQIRAALEAQRRFREYRARQQAQAPNLQQPVVAEQPAPNIAHPNNRIGARFPALFVQLWPHIWSLFRLGLFVWFFTSSNSSWSRWIMVVSLAIGMFIFNGGWLNGAAERIWQPFARHLDDIFPAIDRRHGVQRPGANNNQAGAINEAPTLPDQVPNPDQIAARLVAERRAQPTWLGGHLRRIERAGLLFLASIAPGVAERHIANIEAEAQAEEARRRAAEEAAAANAEEAATDGAETSGETGGNGENNQATETTVTNSLPANQNSSASGVSDSTQQDDLRERNLATQVSSQ